MKWLETDLWLDENLSMNLQLDSELTLEKATAAARQHESVRQQQEFVWSGQKSTTVEAAVQFKKLPGNEPAQATVSSNTECLENHQQQQLTCTLCGKAPFHPKQQYPACDAECHKCRKVGHFQSMCRSWGLSEIETEQPSYAFFLSTIDNVSSTKKSWTADVEVNGVPIRFKVDTGADVTAIPLNDFHKLADVCFNKIRSSTNH